MPFGLGKKSALLWGQYPFLQSNATLRHLALKRCMHTRTFASLLITACLAAPSAPAQNALPMLGDGADITANTERRLGDEIIRSLYRDPDYLDDAILGEYVEGIFQSLLQAAKARGELSPELQERFAWNILLGRDRSVNAFALPGGYFGVHLGLIAVVGSRDELASVLAHELSHVTQRHIARLIGQQGRQAPWMLGAMVLGALAASRNPEAGQALMVGGQALAAQNQLNFSRDMEREADRIGYSLMETAGFAPQGFVTMFDKLQQANRLNDNGSWPYLRSHPLTTQRIADMRGRLEANATPSPATAQSATLEHTMMVARARVLMRPGTDQWRQWASAPDAPGFAAQPLQQRISARYTATLSAVQLNDFERARAALQALRADLPAADTAAQRQVRLLAAELHFAARQPQAALQALETPQTKRPELLLRAQALLALGRANDIRSALQTRVATHPQDAAAWQLLAHAWQQQKHPLRALRAEAEAHFARYDYPAAIDRLKAGQALARTLQPGNYDHIEASIIDTRLRAVEALLKEQTNDARER